MYLSPFTSILSRVRRVLCRWARRPSWHLQYRDARSHDSPGRAAHTPVDRSQIKVTHGRLILGVRNVTSWSQVGAADIAIGAVATGQTNQVQVGPLSFAS